MRNNGGRRTRAGAAGKPDSLGARILRSGPSYALMAPFLLVFAAFTVIPVFAAVFLSFTSFNMLQAPKWAGWGNYVRLVLDDQLFLVVLKNTLVFAFLTGPVSYLVSFFLAWFINDFKPWVRALLTLVFYFPSLAGNVFIVWGMIFSGDAYGMVNGILMDLGLLREPVLWLQDPKHLFNVLVFVQLWLSMGASFLAFIAGFQTIDKSLYEAGVIDGIKNRWQELWYITIPSMAPQLLFGAVMQIAASFGVSEVITALGGFPTRGYAGDTVTTYIQDYGTVRFEMGYASAIAVVLFITMLLTNKVITGALKRYMD
jgi:multiple sugar transport system permease protein